VIELSYFDLKAIVTLVYESQLFGRICLLSVRWWKGFVLQH